MPPTPHQQQHDHHHVDENASPPLLGRRQDLLMPAASESSSTAADGKPRAITDKNMPAGGDRKVEPLIVFDWDDTILTSSWIQVNKLLQAVSYDELPLDVKQDLAQLEQSVVKCLKNARRLGTVIIITNAESGWVELSAARFFVGVLPLLEGVPVISARSLFESQFPGSPLCWKSAAFAYMMHDHFLDRPQWLQKKVVSIGDSNEEKVAMRIASGQHGTMAAKAIKFITGPDPEALSCQLDFVTQHLASVVSSDSDVDIVLDASMIHGSYSLPLHSRGVYDDHHQQHQHQQQQQHHHHQHHQRRPRQEQHQPPTTATSRPSSPSSSSPAPSRRDTVDPSRTDSASVRTTAPSSTASDSPMSPQATAGSCSGSTSDDGAPFGRGQRGGGEGGVGRSGVLTPTPTKSSFSRRDGGNAPPSPSSSPHPVALERRTFSSPIAMPLAVGHIRGDGRGHGRTGRTAKGVGAQGVEGGGDCVQPFPPAQVEVGGSFASFSSSSPSSPSSSSSRARAAAAAAPTSTRPTAQPLSQPPASFSSATRSASCGGGGGGGGNLEGGDDAMALSSTSFDRDCCAPAGGGGGSGADGGGGSPCGGGHPCGVDGGGRRSGDASRSTGMVTHDKPRAGSAIPTVIFELGETVASKVALIAADEGGSASAAGDDGMCGVAETATETAAAVRAAPKA